jgi:hypothetical protein
MSSTNEDNEKAIEQERNVMASPDVVPMEEQEEEESEDEAEDEEEDRESDEVEEREEVIQSEESNITSSDL